MYAGVERRAERYTGIGTIHIQDRCLGETIEAIMPAAWFWTYAVCWNMLIDNTILKAVLRLLNSKLKKPTPERITGANVNTALENIGHN